MPNVTAIAYTGYPVTDLARARNFYEKLLGLKPGTAWEGDGKGWIEYELGDNCLAITNGSDQWKPSAEGAAVVLEVADMKAAVAELKAAGVKFKVEPMEFPPCHLAIVFDPDGNQVGLHQKKATA